MLPQLCRAHHLIGDITHCFVDFLKQVRPRLYLFFAEPKPEAARLLKPRIDTRQAEQLPVQFRPLSYGIARPLRIAGHPTTFAR